MDEIINRVSESKLMVFDLEDYYPSGIRKHIDISQWLEGGFLLREKQFRADLKNFAWSQYQDCLVSISSSTDAIIPAWATILLTIYLTPYAKKICGGNTEALESALYQEILPLLDYTEYLNKSVIIKGCAKKPVPMSAYVLAAQYLQPFASSIMYGEACSAVPLFKRK